MSNVTMVRPGQVQNTSDRQQLFRRHFRAAAIEQFERENWLLSRHSIVTIEKGNGFGFPIVGQVTAAYREIGTFPTEGQQLQRAERTIYVDNVLEAYTWLNSIEEKMANDDSRGHLAREMGQALRRTFEDNAFIVAVNGARQPSPLAGTNPATGKKYNGGAQIALGSSPTDASLRTVFLKAAETLDSKFIPSGMRTAALPLDLWYLWFNGSTVGSLVHMNKDVGGSGSVTSGTFLEYMGFQIHKVLSLPRTSIAATDSVRQLKGTSGTQNTRLPTGSETGPVSVYTGDFTNTRGLFMAGGLMGTVRLMDITTAEDYDEPRMATYLAARYLMGHGVLDPQQGIEIVAGGTLGTVTNF
jgi:hypothetical protein